ncbi:TPR-like protein [Guyanagaster necrorhizus]|uniref:TPR-like protein n=1 Tax=Guyanagaster necrorhizus TaxID=856835 RepID=A0A9P8AW68_9AGAR|nr:TPR-like protein [Guyanagaster necrorhizus MCA 3950]KAG7450319.1 TPR-like protein [Guyanagaster necrorhizus MCA 3950]
MADFNSTPSTSILTTSSIEQETDTIKKSLQYAEELKLEGNDHFRQAQWNEALVAYQSGLGHLPKRRFKSVSELPENILRTNDKDREIDEPDVTSDRPEVVTEMDKECARARAVLNANIGACFVKMNEYKQAVEACSQALVDDPHYIKALQRRAASNDQIGSWTSLTSAQEDYNALLKTLPPNSSQIKEIERSLQRLKPRLDDVQKRETAEMLEKLKGLGNSVLGNFGLSTDNFQFVPNGQGGYNMNFSR